jgi:DNA repair exonuclease SbcCD ATPase subunit
MPNIKLKTLSFSNMFSYGNANKMTLDKNRITQLTAPNGSGKSSIAMIIQEIMFNKNVKGIKKSDILNRWSKTKQWSGSLEFEISDKQYEISVTRSGAQTKVKLTEDGVDISDHKVLDTYKKIQQIIGLDFEVFSQLTYQSSTDLLEFLRATDTNRKKFLINLFNLEKYIQIGERIKAKATSTDREGLKLQGELKSVDDFLKFTTIPQKQELIDVTEIDPNLQRKIGVLAAELDNYNETCKKIDRNNMYITERDNLSFRVDLTKPEPFEDSDKLSKMKDDFLVVQNELKGMKTEFDGIDDRDTCLACGQKIDNDKALHLKTTLENKIYQTQSNVNLYTNQINTLEDELRKHQSAQRVYEQNQKAIERFEQLSQLIDKSIPTEYPNVDSIKNDIKDITDTYNMQKRKHEEAMQHNNGVSAHNAKVDALLDQKEDFKNRQVTLKNDTVSLQNQLNSLNILKKAFSTSGIVAFKLENLTKELEITINHYLSLLSDGQFQVEFKLDKEKLNISVINNGIGTPIETVSGGEFSRIQTSILLAIRSLLSKLGGSSINLLFLDEITGVLDDEGKEKLIEVLQNETNLNVFLISHDFTHPLIEKISIEKQENISSIK